MTVPRTSYDRESKSLFTKLAYHLVHAKVYEPKRRLCGGRMGWVRHRFPIKNGISWRDVMIAESLRQNVLFKLVRLEKESEDGSSPQPSA